MAKVVKSVVRALPAAAIAFVASGFNPWAPVAVLASAAVAGALTKTPKLNSTDRPRSVTVSSSVAPQLVVYGRTRVGTIRAFAASSTYGAQVNGYLHQVLILCTTDADGIEAVEDVYFGDEVVPLQASGAGFVPPPGHRLGPYVYIEKHLGAAGQQASATLTAAGVGWDADCRLQGIAYLYVRLAWDKTKGPDTWPTGLPNISAIVKGQKIYDPRTGEKRWSNNFALCVRDFLSQPYGYGCEAGEIDDSLMIAAANLSDEPVTLADGSTQPRYTMDGAAYLEGPPGEAVEQMLAAGLATLTYMRGAWRLYPAAYRPPVPGQLVLTADHLREAPTIDIDPPRDAVCNVVQGRFTDPVSWQVSEFPPFTAAEQRAADGEHLVRDIDLPYVQDPVQAQRLAKIVQRQSRRGTVTWPGTYACLPLRVGETVAVTLPLLGWSAKVFRIENWQLAANGMGVDLMLREDIAADYAWLPAEEAALPAPPPTTLPLPSMVLPPVGFTAIGRRAVLADGTVAPAIEVTIAASPDAMVRDHLVRWRPEAASEWQIVTVPAGGLVHVIPVQEGEYLVSAAAISGRGVTSQWLAARRVTLSGAMYGARVVRLELFGQGPDTEFEGPDVRLVWSVAFPDRVPVLGVEAYGLSTTPVDPYLAGYVVRVYDADTGAMVRVEAPRRETEYVYRYEDNVRDGGPRRRLVFSVSIAPKTGPEIGTAQIGVSNPRPGLPDALTVTPVFGGARVTYLRPRDTDWTGCIVAMGTASDFSPEPASWAYRGPDTGLTVAIDPGATRYIRVALTDAFGVADLQWSAPVAIQALRINTADLSNAIIGEDKLTATLNARLTDGDANVAALQVLADTHSDELGHLSASYTVKVDVAGRVAGFGLASEANNGLAVSHFAVVADKFSVARPGGGPDKYVFTAGTHPDTGEPTLVLSGVVYADTINANQIKAGTINAARIGDGSLPFIKIANDLESLDYVPGRTGWRIDKGGDAEFNGVVISRPLVVHANVVPGSGGVYPIVAADGWKLLGTWTFDTTYTVGAWWNVIDRIQEVRAGISRGEIVATAPPGGAFGAVAQWSCKVTEAYALTKWAGDEATTLWVTVEFWAQVYGDVYQLTVPDISYSIFQVT